MMSLSPGPLGKFLIVPIQGAKIGIWKATDKCWN